MRLSTHVTRLSDFGRECAPGLLHFSFFARMSGRFANLFSFVYKTTQANSIVVSYNNCTLLTDLDEQHKKVWQFEVV